MKKIVKYGVALYTSDELNNKLKELVSKDSSLSNQVSSILTSLIDKHLLIAVINEPGKIKQLIMKLRKIRSLDYYGFADNDGAYVLFTEGVPAKEVVNTALHEIIHYINRKFPKQFLSINIQLYSKFYSEFYSDIFKTKKYNDKVFSLFLFNFLKKDSYDSDILKKAFVDYTPLSEKEIDKIINMVFEIWDSIEANTFNKIPSSNLIIKSLEKTYITLFGGRDKSTKVGQEIYKPHEIIAILSTINPNYPNVIKSLRIIS